MLRVALWTARGVGATIPVMADPVPEEDKLARFLDRTTIQIMYKPVGIAASLLGGMLASVLFGRIWRAVAGRKAVPGATDEARSWVEILLAAAVQGVVFGVVRALVDRAGAKLFQSLTGRWPGKRAEEIEGEE
jgi:hypothetical protein